MAKQIYVSSQVQAVLLKEVLIPQMENGFWKDHRPAEHYKQWQDVEIIVSSNDGLGFVDFKAPRTYNFVNPDFIKPNEKLLVEAAQRAKASSNFRSVKKELIELSRIVGGRLTSKSMQPTKANRGVSRKAKTVEVPSFPHPLQVTGKRTAVKKKDVGTVTTTVTKSGATVRRVEL